MDARKFWNEFSTLFIDKNKLETAKSVWQSSKDYTDYILEQIESILSTDDLETSREYYRIDLIGYKNKKNGKTLLLPEYRFKNYQWDLEVAVEHENSSYTWMDEVVKLLHIYCPLRVVIGYIPLVNKKEHKKYLDKIYNNIKTLKAKETLNDNNFLIIIGDSECGNDSSKFCNYTPYIYKNNGFELLK